MMPIERFKPATREQWLALRNRDVTASRVGVLVDPDYPYCTRFQYWAEKIGRIKPDDDDSPAKRRGRLLESVAADIAAEHFAPAIATRNELEYWRDPTTRTGGTPDLLVNDPDRGLGCIELKNPNPHVYRTWDHGEPPLWIAVQTITQAKLTGAQWAAVGIMRVGYSVEFDVVPIPIHETAWQYIQDQIGEFWKLVDSGTEPPPDYSRDKETIAKIFAQSEPITLDLSGDDELLVSLAKREYLKAQAHELNFHIDTIDALIRYRAGIAEAFTAGDYRVTLKTEQVKGYTVEPRTRRPIRITNRSKGKS